MEPVRVEEREEVKEEEALARDHLCQVTSDLTSDRRKEVVEAVEALAEDEEAVTMTDTEEMVLRVARAAVEDSRVVVEVLKEAVEVLRDEVASEDVEEEVSLAEEVPLLLAQLVLLRVEIK